MSFINSMINKSIQFLPKWFAKSFASPYVAGETVNEALDKVSELNEKGFSATIDILGEHVKKIEHAREITKQYTLLYEQIDDQNLDCTVSVKPTHIGLMISIEEAVLNMTNILSSAEKFGNFLRIDMESSQYTDETFIIYKECKKVHNNVGFALQAYLYRSENDLRKYIDNKLNIRICKGIYKESLNIAYQNREEISNNFLILAKEMAVGGGFCGYATHDQNLIDKLLDWINTEKISPNSFEFQVLYGVPMSGRLEELVKEGYKVRIYVPFGPDWFDYSIRRLKENPSIAGYVVSNLFKRWKILNK